jgi:membrane protein DedA with SNARE-associated domain
LRQNASAWFPTWEDSALPSDALSCLYWSGSVFLWLFFTGLGLPPIPEEAGILYAAGLTSLHPEVPWWTAWPAASGGIIGADLFLYGLGRWIGPRIFEYRWVLRILSSERRERLEKRFHEHGLKFLLMSRLLPPLRTGVFLIAGSTRYPVSLFLLADAVYGLFGVGLIFFGGTALVAAFHKFGGWLLLVGALAGGVYLLFRYYRYLKKIELKATVSVLKAVAPEVAEAKPSDPHSTR